MTIRFTVGTINLHGRADRWLERRHLMVAEIVENMPDLLALQEISAPIRQAAWLCKQVNVRVSGSEEEPYRLVQRQHRGWLRGRQLAVGVLSRFPVLYAESMSLGYGGRVAVRLHVELPSHQTADFVSTHLYQVPYAREARKEQVMKLLGWLHSHKHVPLQVVAGDFNEVPDGLALQYMKQSFRSAFEEANRREPLATHPTALAGGSEAACLDYIFVSPAVERVVAARLFADQPGRDDETLYPSDHVGLLAMLEV